MARIPAIPGLCGNHPGAVPGREKAPHARRPPSAAGSAAACMASGAPAGNKNALKHGLYTAEAVSLRRHVNLLLREGRRTIEEVLK